MQAHAAGSLQQRARTMREVSVTALHQTSTFLHALLCCRSATAVFGLHVCFGLDTNCVSLLQRKCRTRPTAAGAAVFGS
jgi:hypothetical protein